MDVKQEAFTLNQKVVVVGSYNSDMTIKAARLPRPGETVLGGQFHSGPGGKGANQAVAAARAGAQVAMIARVGDDMLGNDGLRRLRAEHIATDFVFVDSSHPTGTAWVIVDACGENCLVVASGANALLSAADVAKAEALIASADILLVQLESPLPALEKALAIATAKHVRVILNPAPAMPLREEFLRQVSIITPNRIEAEMLTGVKIEGERSLVDASRSLLARGIETVIITLGGHGAFVCTASEHYHCPAFPVQAVDTTAAGDVFNGCFAATIDSSGSLRSSVRIAMAAAALSVTTLGAQESAPTMEAIQKFLGNSVATHE